jgi:DNA-binding beta-propeller fold protein YncE
VAAYRLSDGEFLASAPVGIHPDSIAIAPNGQCAVIANEAEAVTTGNNGGPGSLTLVDLKGFKGAGDLEVTSIPLPSLAGLDLTHHRGLTLVAVALERANAVALIDVSDPTDPTVISIVPVGVGPEGIKFLRDGSQLFLAVANEVSGTLSIIEVVL